MRNREQKAQRHMQAKQRKTIRRRQRRGAGQQRNTSHERQVRLTEQVLHLYQRKQEWARFTRLKWYQ